MKNIVKIRTLWDVRQERHQAEARSIARDQARATKLAQREAAVQGILRSNPNIGVLCRRGKPMYYTYPVGGVYTESRDPAALAMGAAS